MTHGSLFTGIGGFDLAAEIAGFENVWQIEKDNYCNKILEKNFPNAKRFGDIKTINKKELESVDVISGGFPCQPYSLSGKRRGKEDDRALWKEMFEVIKEIRPPFILCENVIGLITMELDEVLFDLESEGYTTETFVLPACSINAPHRRYRVWIIAYFISKRSIKGFEGKQTRQFNQTLTKQLFTPDSQGNGFERFDWREKQRRFGLPNWDGETNWSKVATRFCRMDDGLPGRMDGFKLTKAQHRAERLKGLGNAIVPSLALMFFLLISEIYEQQFD